MARTHVLASDAWSPVQHDDRSAYPRDDRSRSTGVRVPFWPL